MTAFLFFPSSPAYAACSSPSGVAGEMYYNTSYSMAQYCDGTNWIAMGRSGATPASLPGGLIGHWKLDESSGTTAADSSGSGNNGTLNSMAGTEWATGKVDNALEFDGNDDAIYITGSSPQKTAMTVTGWFSSHTAGSFNRQHLYSESYTGNCGTPIFDVNLWDGDSGTPGTELRLEVDSVQVASAPMTFLDDTWYFFAAVFDSVNDIHTVYVNNLAYSNSLSRPAVSNTTVNARIGNSGGSCQTEAFNGLLDDIRVYDHALSAEEVASIYGPSSSSGLAGHWKLDETSGTTISDSSIYENDGTLLGSMNASADTVSGPVGTALDFDGTDDVIDIPANTNFYLDASGQYTWSVWLNSDDFTHSGGWANVFSQTINNADFFLIYAHTISDVNIPGGSVTNGVTVWWYSDNNTTHIITEAENVLTEGSWYHIAVTYDGSQSAANRFKIYVNGTDETGSSDISGTISDLFPAYVRVGGDEPWGEYFDGRIDDVRFYTRLLSASEIANLYVGIEPVGDCSTPGKIEYNTSEHVMQFCSDLGSHAMGPLADCSEIGALCDDGSIFAGDTNLYVTDENQSTAAAWKTSTGTDDINPDSSTDGQANHDNRAGTLSNFPAFELCENLTRHGHSDWYLPALNELNTLYLNQAAINASASENFVTASAYWSSTENSTTQAKREIFSDGTQGNTTKTSTRNIRCVRRGATPSAEKPVPVAWWKLDEISGTSTADSSGNGYTGTMQSGLDAGNNAVEGKFGNALTFDGVDDYIGIGQTYISTLSVSLWFYYDETPASEYTLFHRGYANSCRYMPLIGIDSGDMLGTNGTGGCGGGISGIPVSKGVWNHVVLTVTNGSQVLYLNGSAVGSDTDGFWGESLYTVIGGYAQLDDGIATGNYFKGKIDDVRIYDKALSLSEVQAIYNNADCSTPDGVEGQMYYNTSYDVMQYCNGAAWISIGK